MADARCLGHGADRQFSVGAAAVVRAVQEAALTRRAWLSGLLASLVAGFRRLRTQGVSPPTAANPNQPVRVNGRVVRVSAGDLQPERFWAVCTVCPHEQCEVDFVSDPENLDPLVRAEIGAVSEPVYLCSCHNSTFTMAEGTALGGPTLRGLYRFRVTAVTQTAVEIGEVEDDVLLFFAG